MGSQQGRAVSGADLCRQGGQWWSRPKKKLAEPFRHKLKAGTTLVVQVYLLLV